MAHAAHTLPGLGPRRRPRARSTFLLAQEAHDRFGGIALAIAILMNFLLAVAAGLSYLRPPKLKLGFTSLLFAVIGHAGMKPLGLLPVAKPARGLQA
jgi:hypothetical protein